MSAIDSFTKFCNLHDDLPRMDLKNSTLHPKFVSEQIVENLFFLTKSTFNLLYTKLSAKDHECMTRGYMRFRESEALATNSSFEKWIEVFVSSAFGAI